jgi:hypothetical protein
MGVDGLLTVSSVPFGDSPSSASAVCDTVVLDKDGADTQFLQHDRHILPNSIDEFQALGVLFRYGQALLEVVCLYDVSSGLIASRFV